MLARTLTRSPGPLARALDRFLINRAAVFGVCLALPVLAMILSYPLWWTFKPNDIDLLAMNSGPSSKHWFGTDGVGRDVFARVMEGGRISLLVAVASTLLSAIIGFLFGAVSALAGRWTDAVGMRFVDLVMTLPPVIFLLVLASIAGTGIWPTVLVISLLSWPLLARMVRARLWNCASATSSSPRGEWALACRTSSSGTVCRTRSISWLSTRRCRSPTPSCSKPAFPSLVSALPRRPPLGQHAERGPLDGGARTISLAMAVPRRGSHPRGSCHQLHRRRASGRFRPSR